MEAREGRAQRPIADIALVQAWSLVMKVFTPFLGSQAFVEFDESIVGSKLENLKKTCLAQVFGMAAGHVETGKPESALLPCWRFQTKGIRTLVLVYAFDVVKHLSKLRQKQQRDEKVADTVVVDDAIDWITTASLEDLDAFAKAHPEAIRSATVGPQDALWTPMGWLQFHQALLVKIVSRKASL